MCPPTSVYMKIYSPLFLTLKFCTATEQIGHIPCHTVQVQSVLPNSNTSVWICRALTDVDE